MAEEKKVNMDYVTAGRSWDLWAIGGGGLWRYLIAIQAAALPQWENYKLYNQL